MLRFLAHKLRTQSLNEEPETEKDPEEHDSGTESDDESGEPQTALLPGENNKMDGGDTEWELEGSSGVFPINFTSRNSMEELGSELNGSSGRDGRDSVNSQFESSNYIDSALPSDSDHVYDNHSSEEELEDIHNSYQEVDELRSESLSGMGEEDDLEVGGRGGIGGSENKRKWSQVASNRLSVESSSSSDEEFQGLLRPVSTPVEFCTSPPVDAHKPSRSQSPPPKLFLFSSPGEGAENVGVGIGRGAVAIHPGGVFRGLRRCDQNVVGEHRHSHHGASPHHHHHFIHPYSNGTDAYSGGGEIRSHPTTTTTTDQSNISNLATMGGGGGRTSRNGGNGSGNNGREVSSRHKRHRHHNPRHIQRPWLDFEKMQQLKARAVTSWRCGGELSLYCS